MAKVSKKDNKSIYQLTRESLGLTREKVSELTNLPPERIERCETGKVYLQPIDVLELSKCYNKPELCNYYCNHECPIGQKYVPEIKVEGIESTVLKMISSLNTMTKKKDRLIEIIEDGKVTKDEIEDFINIQQSLEKISITVETLQLWVEKMLATGKIDNDLYKKYLSEYEK